MVDEVCGADGCAVPGTAAAPEFLPVAAVPSRIDVVSDAICPWCWVGKRNLEGALALLAAEGEGFEVHWRPFQLNPEMPVEGVVRESYRTAKFGSAERGRELDAQVAAAGRAAGVEFRHALMLRTPNTILAHRVIRRAGEAGWQEQNRVVEALFHAYFHAGQDIGDPAVLEAVSGLPGLAEFLAGPEGDAEVRAEEAGFRRGGLSGVPTFALEGHVLFSGAMPADRIAGALRRGLAILRERSKAA